MPRTTQSCRLQCAGVVVKLTERRVLGEHRKIAVMSEAQFSEFIFLEPRDGIVFVQRDIDRSSRPTFDQPDLHVERVWV